MPARFGRLEWDLMLPKVHFINGRETNFYWLSYT